MVSVFDKANVLIVKLTGAPNVLTYAVPPTLKIPVTIRLSIVSKVVVDNVPFTVKFVIPRKSPLTNAVLITLRFFPILTKSRTFNDEI